MSRFNVDIAKNVKKILGELPEDVQLVAAAKARTPEEVLEAVNAGVRVIGENYVQEAEKARSAVGGEAVKWHFIGYLQKNKVKKAVEIFDMIETVDSLELAGEINKRCLSIDRKMPVLIEINSGMEDQKSGVVPEKAESLIREIALLSNVRVQGLMTMGPFTGDPEDARPYFQETKKVFDQIASLDILDVEMKYLSMGMTNSYLVAVEEGANIVRIGTLIFGEREERKK
jgi:pyridoxal phosphate enzyme (YggS family)